MADSSILLKQFDGSNYSQYFPQNLPLDIANQFVNSEGKNSNDIFNYLRKYCQYWWKLIIDNSYVTYKELQTSIKTWGSGPNLCDYGSSHTIQYSKNISINQTTRKVSLSSPRNMSIKYNDSYKLWEIRPVYITQTYSRPDNIFYIPSDATYRSDNRYTIANDSNTVYLGRRGVCAFDVTAQSETHEQTNTEFRYSTNRQEYPDNETVNKTTYSFLRIPIESIFK